MCSTVRGRGTDCPRRQGSPVGTKRASSGGMALPAMVRHAVAKRVLVPEILPPLESRRRRRAWRSRFDQGGVSRPWRMDYGGEGFESDRLGLLLDVYG